MTSISAHRGSSGANAQSFIDAVYGILREGLVLVGIATTTDDPRSARRAGRKALELSLLAADMLRFSKVDESQRGRLNSGLRNLQRCIEQLDTHGGAQKFS